MILVDTSVWIDRFRGGDRPKTRLLAQSDILGQIVTGDIVLLEILQGARSDDHARGLEQILRSYPIVDLLGEAMATEAARHFRHLRGLGITMKRTTDLIIGTWCIAHDARLLHDDRDFDVMARHLGLMVANEG